MALAEAGWRGSPRILMVVWKRAGVHIAQNTFAAATKLHQEVIGLGRVNVKAFIDLGIAYLHRGDKALTRAALEEAMRLEPKRKQ